MTDPNSEPPPLPTTAVVEEAVDASQADEEAESAKGCAGCVGCFAIVVVLIMIINVACPSSGPFNMETGERDHQYPDAGDQCVVAPQGGGGNAWGFATDAAFEEGMTLLRAGDETGIIEQMLNGTMVMLDRGDRLLVIERQLNWTTESRMDVRMQSGSFDGMRLLMRQGDVAFTEDSIGDESAGGAIDR